MRESPFSRRSVILLIACVTALVAASFLLRAFGENLVLVGNKPVLGVRSISAIGHAGFYDLLRRLDRPVSRSAGSALSTVGTKGTLIVAEPRVSYVIDDIESKIMQAPRLLLVLPKWHGTPDESNHSWVSEVETVPLNTARRVLSIVTGPRSTVFRKALSSDVKNAWQINTVGIEPSLHNLVQLIRADEMTPIVGDNNEILLGEIGNSRRKIWILSDPDVLSNHGITNGDNAAFMLAVVDALRLWNNSDLSAPIVFDESVHGSQVSNSSPLELLFNFPFVIVTALFCAAVAILAASGAGRFGAPVVPKPVLNFGKANLIGNGARLLDYAGHHPEVLKRYIRMTIQSAANALRALRHDDSTHGNESITVWLDRVGKSRGVSSSCTDIAHVLRASNAEAESSLPRLFEGAKRIYDWKQEILKVESVGPSIHKQRR